MINSIQQLKDSKRMTMTKRQLFWHSTIVVLFLILPVLTTIDLIKQAASGTTATGSINDLFWESYILLLPALIFHFIQKRNLQFKVLDVSLDEASFQEMALKAAKWMEWKVVESADSYLVAQNGASWRSFGERITIIRDSNKILFNSIGDPANFYTVPYSGLNQRNRTMFEEQLKELVSNKNLATAGAGF